MSDIITTGTSSNVDSTTDSAEVVEFEFSLENDKDGIITVSDELLDTEAIAQERATSEFLQNSYRKKEVRFDTFRTDFEINEIIIVVGLKYIIKSIYTAVNGVSMVTNITAIRYEE